MLRNLAEQIHAFADHFGVQTYVWEHLIEVTHVRIAHIVHLQMILGLVAVGAARAERV